MSSSDKEYLPSETSSDQPSRNDSPERDDVLEDDDELGSQPAGSNAKSGGGRNAILDDDDDDIDENNNDVDDDDDFEVVAQNRTQTLAMRSHPGKAEPPPLRQTRTSATSRRGGERGRTTVTRSAEAAEVNAAVDVLEGLEDSERGAQASGGSVSNGEAGDRPVPLATGGSANGTADASPARRSSRRAPLRAVDAGLAALQARKDRGRKRVAHSTPAASGDDSSAGPSPDAAECTTETDVTELQTQALRYLIFRRPWRLAKWPGDCANCDIKICPDVHKITFNKRSEPERHSQHRTRDGREFEGYKWSHVTCKRGPDFWQQSNPAHGEDLPAAVKRLLEQPLADMDAEGLDGDGRSDSLGDFFTDESDDGCDDDDTGAVTTHEPKRKKGRVQRRSDRAGPSTGRAIDDAEDLGDVAELIDEEEESGPAFELISVRRIGQVFSGHEDRLELLEDAGLSGPHAKSVLDRAHQYLKFGCDEGEDEEQNIRVVARFLLKICNCLTLADWDEQVRRIRVEDRKWKRRADKELVENWEAQVDDCVQCDFAVHAVEKELQNKRNALTTQAFAAASGPLMHDLLSKPFFTERHVLEGDLEAAADAETKAFNERHDALRKAADDRKQGCPLCKRETLSLTFDGISRALVAVNCLGPRCPLDLTSSQPTAAADDHVARRGQSARAATLTDDEDDDVDASSSSDGTADKQPPDWAQLSMAGVHALQGMAFADKVDFAAGESASTQRSWLLGPKCRVTLHALHLCHHFVWRAALRLRAELVCADAVTCENSEAQGDMWHQECTEHHRGLFFELYTALCCLLLVSQSSVLGPAGDMKAAISEVNQKLAGSHHNVLHHNGGNQWVSSVLEVVEDLLGQPQKLSELDPAWCEAWFLPCIPDC